MKRVRDIGDYAPLLLVALAAMIVAGIHIGTITVLFDKISSTLKSLGH